MLSAFFKIFAPLMLILLALGTILPSHAHKNHKIGKTEHPAIKARHSLMEDSAFAAKQAGKMVTGATPYDASKAELTMRLIRATAHNMQHYFPKDSIPKAKSKSESSPKIWQNMQDFLVEIDKFKKTSSLALKQASQDEQAFKQGFMQVMGSCKSCHEKYRIKKQK